MKQKDHVEREYTRVPKEAAIEINVLEYPLPAEPGEPAKAVNLAENGLCLTVPSPYDIGTVLSLNIDLKGWRRHLTNVSFKLDDNKANAPLTVVSEVVWCESAGSGQYEVGMKFINIYEDDLVAFGNYLSALRDISG